VIPDTASSLVKELLNAFFFTLSGGYARTIDDVLWLFSALASLELIVAALAWGFWRQNWMAALVWKVLGFAVILWFLSDWPNLFQALQDGFIAMGLKVGDSAITIVDFKDPGNLIDFGITVNALMMENLRQMSWLNYSLVILFAGGAGFAIICAYIWIAGHIFKALLEYALATACLIFLVPFLAFEKTAPFGERVFGTFLAQAFRLLVYAVVLSCALPVLHKYTLPAEPTFGQVMRLLGITGVFFSVAMSAPAFAMGLIQGAPVLSFSNLLMGTQSLAQTAGALGAVGAAASVAGASALRGAVSGASAYRAAAQLGAGAYRAANPGSGGLTSTVVGGVQGLGRYATQQMFGGFRAAVQQGRVNASRVFPPHP
jgi:type IV secretion system protein TrbL